MEHASAYICLQLSPMFYFLRVFKVHLSFMRFKNSFSKTRVCTSSSNKKRQQTNLMFQKVQMFKNNNRSFNTSETEERGKRERIAPIWRHSMMGLVHQEKNSFDRIFTHLIKIIKKQKK